MDDLVMHPQTKAELLALRDNPPHALLLIGEAGTGKRTIASTWALQFAETSAISVLAPDEKGTISIDATRGLYQHTRSKQQGRQVVIIDQANAMSIESQNAFLKLLEEPRQDLTFILTTPTTDSLLPTILSRVQSVRVQPVSPQALAAMATKIQPSITAQELQQLLFVANGRPAAVAAMLSDASVFDHHKQLMQRAKSLLSAPRYERLAMIATLTKDRSELMTTLQAMAHMLMLQIHRQPSAKQLALADNLQITLQRIRQNGNIRAQLVHLFTSY